MRVDRETVLRYRALFGLGFIVLGALMIVRVAVAAAPPSSKILGLLLGVAVLALGIVRVRTFWKSWRESQP